MLAHWKWRTSFSILGILGLVWAGCWVLWFRDHPEDAVPSGQGPAVEPTMPTRQIGAKGILGSWPLTLAMLQYFASNFTFFIGLSWMLPYLKMQFHLADGQGAAHAMAP